MIGEAICLIMRDEAGNFAALDIKLMTEAGPIADSAGRGSETGPKDRGRGGKV
jgi:hypothetical protein